MDFTFLALFGFVAPRKRVRAKSVFSGRYIALGIFTECIHGKFSDCAKSVATATHTRDVPSELQDCATGQRHIILNR